MAIPQKCRQRAFANDGLPEAQTRGKCGCPGAFSRHVLGKIAYQPALFPFVAWIGRKGSGPSGETMRFGANLILQASGKASLPDYYVLQQNWATFEMYQRNFLEKIEGDADPTGYKIYRLK